MGFRIYLPDAKADARHQERVAKERRKLRDREARRAAGPRLPRGNVNLNTLGLRLMMHIEPTARPDVNVPMGKSVLDVVGVAKKPIIYVGGSSGHSYVVLTPPPMKYEIGAEVSLLIVRGPKPFQRAVASVTLAEYGEAEDVRLPQLSDWTETECGDSIFDYARELGAYVNRSERVTRAPKEDVADTQQAAGQRPDVLMQVSRLGELRDAGVLTEEEFAAKKTELLARL